MPPSKGRHGIRDFTPATSKTNPKQECNLPHEGDVFCGNDNNRRSAHAKMKFEAESAGEEFDHDAAWKALGGKVEQKAAPEVDEDEIEPQKGTPGDETSSPTDPKGTPIPDAPTKPVAPGTAPAWKANA